MHACMPMSFISAGKVILRYGDKEKYLNLEDGRIHLPTVKKAFDLQNAELNGGIQPSAADGFTFNRFHDGDTFIVTGDPAAGAIQITLLQLYSLTKIPRETSRPPQCPPAAPFCSIYRYAMMTRLWPLQCSHPFSPALAPAP